MAKEKTEESKSKENFYGTIVSVPKGEEFAFIGIKTVTKGDGSLPNELQTTEDIFLHQDDCASPLKVGIQVSFFAGEDRHRGKGFCRAFGAMEIVEAEPIGSPIEGFYIATRAEGGTALVPVVSRASYHLGVKEVSQETINQVLENEPLREIPREFVNPSDEEKLQMLGLMLDMFFPAMKQFHANNNILEMDSADFDRAIRENEDDLQALGMTSQVQTIRKEVEQFKGMKATLKLIYDDGLVRPDTIIPIKYLPDIFMAVPVWYFWVKPESLEDVEEVWEDSDPLPQEETVYFCDLFHNQRWADTYQMFNRRMRSLKMYDGDKVPPFVSRRLRKAVEAFDYIVIATPYHMEAGKDWQDINWLQLIDPYVLGFKKGNPFFFILARFSDAGTFPLYLDMVADTIEFLRSNKDKLSGFDEVQQPYWYKDGEGTGVSNLGTVLKKHTGELITAFEQGNLFDWLRGSSEAKLAKKQK